MPRTCLRAFEHFAGDCPQGLCLYVAVSCGEGVFIVYSWLILFGRVIGLVIEYVLYVNTRVECYFIYRSFKKIMVILQLHSLAALRNEIKSPDI